MIMKMSIMIMIKIEVLFNIWLLFIIPTHRHMLLQTRSILSDILPQMVDADQNLTSSMLLSLNRFFIIIAMRRFFGNVGISFILR